MKTKKEIKASNDSVDSEALRHWMKTDLKSRFHWLEDMIRLANKSKKVSLKS